MVLSVATVTPPGIDPGTVRLVAQYLNHYATPGPPWAVGLVYVWGKKPFFDTYITAV